MDTSIESSAVVIECTYRGEHYAVKNNGAILRYSRNGGRARAADNIWTFGKPNKKGYLELASVVVHRIVATAFHGAGPTAGHVVDHIDTNRQNNRPENLRWVTRFENVLLNPLTVRRIELSCGCSVEEFLADPAKYRDKFQEPNYQWMCTVSKAEARQSLERMLSWAKSDKPLQGGSLGSWILAREDREVSPVSVPTYIISKTPGAAQRVVFTLEDKPNEYPSTPQEFQGNPLTAYHKCLTKGATFFRNHNGEYVVVKTGFSEDNQTLYVLTKAAYVYREREEGDWRPVPITELSEVVEDKDLPHSLSTITYEDDLFIHGRMEVGFHATEELEELFARFAKTS